MTAVLAWSRGLASLSLCVSDRSHILDMLCRYSMEGIVLANGRAVIYSDINDAIEVYQRLNQ